MPKDASAPERRLYRLVVIVNELTIKKIESAVVCAGPLSHRYTESQEGHGANATWQ
jgi:hypothetical protein